MPVALHLPRPFPHRPLYWHNSKAFTICEKLSALFTADPVTKPLGNNITATIPQETPILKCCCSWVCVPVLAGLFGLAERWKLPLLVSPALHSPYVAQGWSGVSWPALSLLERPGTKPALAEVVQYSEWNKGQKKHSADLFQVTYK